eukprot:12886308-Prorocentrum_lima.AAC.1
MISRAFIAGASRLPRRSRASSRNARRDEAGLLVAPFGSCRPWCKEARPLVPTSISGAGCDAEPSWEERAWKT